MNFLASTLKLHPRKWLIGLWVLAYSLGLGRELLYNPIIFLQTLPLCLLFGWFVLPQNLLHNLFGLTFASTPMGWQWLNFLGYWLSVLYLHWVFLSTRRWLILLLLSAIILTSTNGCMRFADEHSGNLG